MQYNTQGALGHGTFVGRTGRGRAQQVVHAKRDGAFGRADRKEESTQGYLRQVEGDAKKTQGGVHCMIIIAITISIWAWLGAAWWPHPLALARRRFTAGIRPQPSYSGHTAHVLTAITVGWQLLGSFL